MALKDNLIGSTNRSQIILGTYFQGFIRLSMRVTVSRQFSCKKTEAPQMNQSNNSWSPYFLSSILTSPEMTLDVRHNAPYSPINRPEILPAPYFAIAHWPIIRHTKYHLAASSTLSAFMMTSMHFLLVSGIVALDRFSFSSSSTHPHSLLSGWFPLTGALPGMCSHAGLAAHSGRQIKKCNELAEGKYPRDEYKTE